MELDSRLNSSLWQRSGAVLRHAGQHQQTLVFLSYFIVNMPMDALKFVRGPHCSFLLPFLSGARSML